MKLKLTKIALALNVFANAQTPTGTAPLSNIFPPNLPNVKDYAERAWYRGGNNLGGIAAGANIFGTNFNSPIYTITNGLQRTKLNGTQTSMIAGVSQVVDGYMGISPTGYFGATGNTPWAMLHLDGPNNTTFGGDWRRWMKTGVFMRENSDAMYVGLKQEGFNRSDAVINWSDDVAAGGPDALRFIFSATSDGNGGGITNPINAHGLNGYEVMRMVPFNAIINSTGEAISHVGIGPMFTTGALPQNRLHMNSEENLANFMQITTDLGTGKTATDGLKIGYPTTTATYLTATITQQENDNLILGTNNGERVRVSHIGNISIPTANMNPGALPTNLTRVAISHNPAAPLTTPLSLLHLGYNTTGFFGPPSLNGWRKWMDVGTFTSNSSDHMYVGLKPEISFAGLSVDRQDAIIGWGDNYLPVLPGINTGPDKMRIIFTSPSAGTTGAGPGAMSTADGLEFVRYVPFHNTSLNTNDPRTGFGDFNSLLPVGTIDPRNTVEINSIMNGPLAPANISVAGSYIGSTGASGLRFTDLTKNSAVVPSANPAIDVTKVLSVDNDGNVVLINPTANTLGNICGGVANPLLTNWEVPLNNQNFIFSKTTAGTGRVGIGTMAVACTPGNLLEVSKGTTSAISGLRLTDLATATPLVSNAKVLSVDINGDVIVTNAPAAGGSGIGNLCSATPIPLLGNYQIEMTPAFNFNYTMPALSTAQVNIGQVACATNPARLYVENDNLTTAGSFNSNGNFPTTPYGLLARTINSQFNVGAIGVYGEAKCSGPNSFAYGVRGLANSTTAGRNFGGYFVADNAISSNYGIYASSTTGNAGYFNGDVTRTGTDNFTSDLILKQNIDTITNAIGIINQLKPKTYDYKLSTFPSMHLPSGKQYGLIAQDVQLILPELVNSNVHPAVLDSLGDEVIPSVSYLSLEYQQLTGIIVRAMQQQQTQLHKQDSLITLLQSQIASCCSNASARKNNSNTNSLDIELSDKDAIVLDQNVPNPFAEQTTINYNVPSSVVKAQILFYNTTGQLIQTVDIKTRGKGKVNVFASDLSSGLYHYSLVADGKIIDSKKMVRE